MSGPAYHARTHLTGGTDPLRGLLPSTGVAGDYPAAIRGLDDLRGYWRLGEGAEPFADTSGYNPANPADLDIQAGAGEPMTQDVTPGLLHEDHDDGAVAFNDPDATTQRSFLEDADASSNINFVFGSGHPNMSVIARIKPTSGITTYGGVVADTRALLPGTPSAHTSGWALRVLPSMQVEFFRGSSLGSQLAATSPAISAGAAHSVVGTYDGSLTRLYIDGVLAASVADTSTIVFTGANNVKIGGYYDSSETYGSIWRPFYGVIDEVAVLGSVLSDADIAALHELAETGEVPEGYVPIIGDDGEPIWAPPGTEVEHGDGDEEENPTTGPGAGGAANGSGWHYEDHFEYVVVYDSSPGRFDVPSRKWVRVPFNTVRIQRRWETEPGLFKDAWLPDDRGLTEHAKQGVLLVTPGMTFGSDPQEVSGWYSIEYPMLDWTRLPEFEDPGPIEFIDYYVRGARMINVTNGQVLRAGAVWPEYSSLRVFHDWPFSSPADGDLGLTLYSSDNPYPRYVSNPARPLNKPLPYPKFSNTQSLNDYKSNETGAPGFDVESWGSRTHLPAGAGIILQAWQDSPWPLRFGTDKYPPYTALNYHDVWRKRPGLVLYHKYDPDTVDHDTGALL